MRALALAVPLCLALLSSAAAGPVGDFKADMADAYAAYRMALFATNSGDAAKSVAANAAFAEKWTALRETWAKAPPPHLAEDEAFAGTLDRIGSIITASTGIIAEGNLPEAHERLERIRDEVAALNRRNGVVTFSDHMNAYHAQMEHIAGRTYGPEDGADAIADAGVLERLAGRLEDEAGKDLAANPQFVRSLNAVKQSAATFAAAARSGDAAAIQRAARELKKPYAMLFVPFG